MRAMLRACDFLKKIFGAVFCADAVDYDIDRDILVGIYERVKANEFKPGNDHVSQVMKVQSTIVGKKLVSAEKTGVSASSVS